MSIGALLEAQNDSTWGFQCDFSPTHALQAGAEKFTGMLEKGEINHKIASKTRKASPSRARKSSWPLQSTQTAHHVGHAATLHLLHHLLHLLMLL